MAFRWVCWVTTVGQHEQQLKKDHFSYVEKNPPMNRVFKVYLSVKYQQFNFYISVLKFLSIDIEPFTCPRFLKFYIGFK